MIGTRAGRILGTALLLTFLGSGWGGLRAETLEGDCQGAPLLAAALPLQAASQAARAAGIGVKRATFQGAQGWVTVEVLADEVVHFESGAGKAPGDAPISSSPMVAKTDYQGPSQYQRQGNKLETAALSVTVNPATLCVESFDKRRGYSLGTVCPQKTGLTIDPKGAGNAYGLGEEFVDPDKLPDDWNGKVRSSKDPFGNQMEPFGGGPGGQAGNVQIPVLFALGQGTQGFGLFLDNVYKQTWDFTGPQWKVDVTGGDSQRWYLMAGANVREIRHHYLDLVGRPLVPPKKVLGLWVSEYGWDDWKELEGKLQRLRAEGFPVDGFMMDLQWFGNVKAGSEDSNMGRLAFDEEKFPRPAEKIAQLEREYGVGIIPIEESYVAKGRPEHAALAAKGGLVMGPDGKPSYIDKNPWWGKGGMIDWSNAEGADFWHDWKRQPLVKQGVSGHWIDLGEPEMSNPDGRYHGVVPGKTGEADVHNLFSLLWAESIERGYRRNHVDQRPLILSRSGAAGMQRFGAGLWSADVGSRMNVIAAHYGAQEHLAMAGIDLFGADIGGFHREDLEPGHDVNELYTQWFADASMFDFPARPHTENLSNSKETSPAGIGDKASNLANLRLRYSLAPYYYSLFHKSRTDGDPVIPPLFYWYPEDPVARHAAHEKMIGRDLLSAIVARYGQETRDVYLPKGTWVDFHTGEWHVSKGETITVPLKREGIFQLPLFARAGAIIPRMRVDAQSLNVLGKRADGSKADELYARVYADPTASKFDLIEDDGKSNGYLRGEARTTSLSQQLANGVATVTIAPAQGSYAGAPTGRQNIVELVLPSGSPSAVAVNGTVIDRLKDRAAWEAAKDGWYLEGDMVLVKTGSLPVGLNKKIEARL